MSVTRGKERRARCETLQGTARAGAGGGTQGTLWHSPGTPAEALGLLEGGQRDAQSSGTDTWAGPRPRPQPRVHLH